MDASSTDTSQVNQLRYRLFYAKRGEVESSQLPPCDDTLFMHVFRANYQAAICKRCLRTQPFAPSPNGSGWVIDDDGGLAIEWMRGFGFGLVWFIPLANFSIFYHIKHNIISQTIQLILPYVLWPAEDSQTRCSSPPYCCIQRFTYVQHSPSSS